MAEPAAAFWVSLAADQGGLVARRQLLAGGLSPAQARRRIDSGHWQAVFPGVYATFTGELSDQARVRAALLYAGPPSCAHRTALWLAGALDQAPGAVHVGLPADRRVRAPEGVRMHLSSAFEQRLHPSASPARTRIEDAVLDVLDDEFDGERVLDLVLRVAQRRLTTAGRLRAALARRARHRWRSLLVEVLAEVDDGLASALEFRYARDVERRHGLPRGERNRGEVLPGGVHRYRDVRYLRYRIVVELDGREAHPQDERFRDLRRDNFAVANGDTVLRYGWRDVVGRSCLVAAQVGAVLHTRGWPGPLRKCSSACQIS